MPSGRVGVAAAALRVPAAQHHCQEKVAGGKWADAMGRVCAVGLRRVRVGYELRARVESEHAVEVVVPAIYVDLPARPG
jgi:hypothetical protein